MAVGRMLMAVLVATAFGLYFLLERHPEPKPIAVRAVDEAPQHRR
jgi:hypothetical protein